MNGLRETCHCGHDLASHYRDETVRPAVVRSCLCTGCECKAYADRNGPAPRKRVERPQYHPEQCRCYACKKWLDAQVPAPTSTLKGLPDLSDDYDP